MNLPLFISSLKINLKNMLSYGFATALYLLLIIWVYPSTASMDMEKMLSALPENVRKLTGFQTGVGSLTDFLSGEYYGLLFLIIMMVYSIVTANQLVARLVDRGSMAYLLSTPVSRVRIALTQAAVLVSGLLVITLLTTIGGLLGADMLLANPDLDTKAFLQLNLVGFLLFAIVGAYSFVFSCMLNDEKKSLGLSAVLTLVFYVMNLAGKMTADLAWLKNISIFTAFDSSGISRGTVNVLQVSLGLAGAAAVLFAAGIFIFRKRDLPL